MNKKLNTLHTHHAALDALSHSIADPDVTEHCTTARACYQLSTATPDKATVTAYSRQLALYHTHRTRTATSMPQLRRFRFTLAKAHLPHR